MGIKEILKDLFDEAEIIRRRDGAPDTTLNEQLDADARRALADARLRALAFALSASQTNPGTTDLDDTELLAYLLDTLPEDRRTAIELALRGNVRAFGRLMTLRSAFNTQTDKRDRKLADHPARKIPRHTTKRVEVRRVGEKLQFRDASVAGSHERESVRMALRLAHDFVAKNVRLPELPRPQLRPGPKTVLMLSSMLERTTSLFTTGRDLVEEARTLLARWEKLNSEMGTWRTQQPRTDEVRDNEIEQIGEHLIDVLLRLQHVADQLPDGIRQTLSFTIDKFKPSHAHQFSHYAADPADQLTIHREAPSVDLDDWLETMNIQAGPWPLRLAGTVFPSPALAVTVQGVDTDASCDFPALTLVRPRQGFETANVDSSGLANLGLPSGPSILLVQAEKEVWQVHLTFRDG